MFNPIFESSLNRGDVGVGLLLALSLMTDTAKAEYYIGYIMLSVTLGV